MKIRTSFVGNSSSSSFIAVMKKSTHEKVMKELNKFEKSVVNTMTIEQPFINEDFIIFSNFYTMNGDTGFDFADIDYSIWEGNEEDENSYYDAPEEAINKWIQKAKEIDGKNSVLTHSTDW